MLVNLSINYVGWLGAGTQVFVHFFGMEITWK